MNKTCARCEKTVYPIEELKCLDKIWHKQCFKCQGCGMTLNMRTYKGFNKQPYCEAHIPKVKATTMAETPELKRIAENTKIQSNVKYHADFEKSKGKFTQVADDPETLRIKQNSKIISNVAYHGELEKKAIMEQKRTINENGEYTDDSAANNVNANNHNQQQTTSTTTSIYPPAPPAYTNPPPSTNIGKISDYDPMSEQPRNSPYSSRQHQTVIYTSDRGSVTNPPARKIGSIADIDPVNNVYGSLTNAEYQRNPNHNQYSSYNNYQQQQQPTQMHHHQQINQNQQVNQNQQMKMHQNHHSQQQQMYQQQPVHQQPQQQQPVHQQSAHQTSSRVYRALYDYEAQDSDEVSFCDGDLIVNVISVDRGWMTGQVQRTGETGMLPANYVERAHI